MPHQLDRYNFSEMIPITLHLHNAIRTGQAQCTCGDEIRQGPELRHHAGCRWAAYVEEIYKLERRANDEKISAKP